jgi:hypothetical protein
MDKNGRAFFELVRAGLWETEVRLLPYGEVDYDEVLQLATEQSVVGLVAAGMEHVVDTAIPQEIALQFIGTTLQLEQWNQAMNGFIAEMVKKLREADIYALLVKGQGVAQCYERPLWRASGDVDLFLNGNDYRRAKDVLCPIASSVEEEGAYSKHLSMSIDEWTVELHGTLRSGLWASLDNQLDNLQKEVFFNDKVRIWVNGNTQVFLPGVDEDVVFVFSHILQHFFKEGVGLRQICDWCRLLWTHKDSLDLELLESRLRAAKLITEWKAFSSFAINYLGMPEEVMPFYSNSKCWRRKASRILGFVLETESFGANRDYSYQKKHSYIVYKAISFWRHTYDFFRYIVIFPLDAIKVYLRMVKVGICFVAKGK